jgi:mRNA interferase MazF
MRRGEVVLVDWPYSDRQGSKLRPAVVVQADFLNGIIDDTILVQITGRRHGLPGTEVELDPAKETSSGLLKVSYVCATNLMTAEQALIDQIIGVLSDSVMQQIEGCLKVVMEIR